MPKRKASHRMPIDPAWRKAARDAWDRIGTGAKQDFHAKYKTTKSTVNRVLMSGEDVAFDACEKLRLGLNEMGLADLPPVVEAMRSGAHHEWTLVGARAQDVDQLAAWADLGSRLLAVGGDTFDEVSRTVRGWVESREAMKVADDDMETTNDKLSAPLRTVSQDTSDPTAKTGHHAGRKRVRNRPSERDDL